MVRTLTTFRTRPLVGGRTLQTEAIPGDIQVKNNAGGFVYKLDEMKALDRFLILGTEGGSYYASEKTLTADRAKTIKALVESRGVEVVNRVVEISESGRAPKADPALFTLALAISFGSPATKRAATQALPRVARTGTHLFLFTQYASQLRGWGRVLRNAVADWYTSKDAAKLAYQVTKYQQREGWSHRDLLRLSHAKATGEVNDVLRYVVKGELPLVDMIDPLGQLAYRGYLGAVEQAKKASSAKEIIRLITDYDLPRECIPTQFLKDASVWDALLQKMPMTAMIRNLATMSRVGLLVPMSDASRMISERLQNAEILRKARVHPIQLLSAHRVYKAGGTGYALTRSQGGSFNPVNIVTSALEDAFYKSFEYVEASGKRTFLALDVSGSMTFGSVAGVPGLTPMEAEAAMAMVTVRNEYAGDKIKIPLYYTAGFSRSLQQLTLLPTDSLEAVQRKMQSLSYGSTNCSAPMEFALREKMLIDTFVIYTDNETWSGTIHPSQALDLYRKKVNPDAKLVVVGLTATDFTIARPGDAGMMDVVGFDTAAPRLITEFSQGKI